MSLTFSPMPAGITNQKLALIGLVMSAKAAGRPVLLPRFTAYAAGQSEHGSHPFDEVFGLGAFSAACDGYGVAIGSGQGAECISPHAAFELACGEIAETRRSGNLARFNGLCRLLGALVPSGAVMEKVDAAHRALLARGVAIACQLRIERDWQSHSESRTDPVQVSEHFAIGHREILAKVAHTLGRGIAIYATCDERALSTSKTGIAADARTAADIELIFQSDVMEDADDALHRSLFDFELALRLGTYVGNTRSSFFNGAALTAHGRGIGGAFYVYNSPAPHLKLRTDDGAYPRASLATRLESATA